MCRNLWKAAQTLVRFLLENDLIRTYPCLSSAPLNHTCPLPCHAPSTCSEDGPCESLVTLSCPCGRLNQSVPCGRSATNSSGHQYLTPKCNNECTLAKRNARLAEALGITAETREKTQGHVAWTEELIASARVHGKFLGVVEKALEDFIKSGKKTQLLPPMPLERRKLVHDVRVWLSFLSPLWHSILLLQLANMYRIDTEMIDQEPHRRCVHTSFSSKPM